VIRARSIACALIAVLACREPKRTEGRGTDSAEPLATATTAGSATSLADAESAAPPTPPAPPPTCAAPSLALSGELDAFETRNIEHCVHLPRGTGSCGKSATARIDVDRLRASVPRFDEATVARIVKVATTGKALGMNPRSFALIGDSITASASFLRGYGAGRALSIEIDPDVRPLLRLPDGATIVDFFRGREVERYAGQPLDAFEAERAAKVGARVPFALAGGAMSPALDLVKNLKPAIAIVTFGANDAAYRIAAPSDLADDFERGLSTLVSDLEARGVVVVIENEMRHGDAPGIKACPTDDSMNDWRIAVATNAIVRRTSEIACREHLPFVDLRYAVDGATGHGLGPDATHLSADGRRGGVYLDAKGLDCGYTIREAVTLMVLRDIVALLEERGVFS